MDDWGVFLSSELDPSFILWFSWAKDVYDEDKEAGMDMMVGYVAKVMAEARRD